MGRLSVLLCFFPFFSSKFILPFLSYFPPTRDLPTSQPAQPLVRTRGSTPRGFLGETPPTARNPSPGSSGAWLRFPAALNPAPGGPTGPPDDAEATPGKKHQADAERGAAAVAPLSAFARGSTLRGAPGRPSCAPGLLTHI